MSKGSNRRLFLQGAAGAAATLAIGSFSSKAYAANGKLRCACIGVGGRGGAHVEAAMKENLVALCDSDRQRLESAARSVAQHNPRVKIFTDYRKLFDEAQREFDVVFVATPDHHHAPASMLAIKHGKHVYTEKPLAHSIYEARCLVEAARKAGVATQMGNQGMASEEHRRVCEYIWAGAIGLVREVHVWTDRPINWWPQGLDRPTYTDPVPKHLSWDLWLGPAPQRPYVDHWREGLASGKSLYHPHNWRGWWDFGTGALGDIACHAMAPAFWALKLGKPTAVQAEHSPCSAEMFPNWSIITYEFPARGDTPPVKLVWYDGGKKPPRPTELEQGRQLGDNGVLYIGDRGTMLDHRIIPDEKMRQVRPPEKIIPRVPSHHEDFFIACRGVRPPCSNYDFSGNLTEAALVGNVALRAGRRIDWDAEAMKPKNCSDTEVLRVIRREYRSGWSL
ncbi:MAG: Gfo/Idh/MocA family oxidoreductase [Thermoguttaceae bacterium]|jgi:predicted dehydrogenase